MKIPAAFLLCSLAAALAPAPSAHAGGFSVSPVRMNLAARDRAAALTLVNEGDDEIVLQAEVHRWSQSADGTDRLEATDDLIVSPPILKLAPRARQVVRLAVIEPREGPRQHTYRLVVREVPEALPPKDGAMQVPIALALNLPIFITPAGAKRQVACQLVGGEPHALDAVCDNTGSAYAQVREIQVKRGEQVVASFEGSTYILPGARRAIRLSGAGPGPGEAGVRVAFDDSKADSYAVRLP